MKHNLNETHSPFPADRLVAYQVAKEVLGEVVRLAATWNASLRDQAERAGESALLNVAEGAAQPPGSRAKRRHYDIALASACEIGAALDAAAVRRLSPADEIAAARRLVGRLGALLFGLVRSARR
jgi:four helix bundle protein